MRVTERSIRIVAEHSDGQIISGQRGYKLTVHATLDEVSHAENWLKSQASKMVRRANQIRIVRAGYSGTPAGGQTVKAIVTRIDYISASGNRGAVIQRVENDHVPPLGVTWSVFMKDGGDTLRVEHDHTSKAVASRIARAWCKR